jgi:hypothetical protein
MNGCQNIYSSYVHGSKGLAIGSSRGDCGLPSSIFKGQSANSELLWESNVHPDEQNPYRNEWADLVTAVPTASIRYRCRVLPRPGNIEQVLRRRAGITTDS